MNIPTLNSGRILLVEDEQDIADMLKLNLEIEEYKVVAVRDGNTAVQRFKEENFDLVILDVMLPGMDGLSVCESIRLINQVVPILFLSARGSSEDRIDGLRKGGDDYLAKPFNLEELMLRVKKLLERSKTHDYAPGLKEFHFGPGFMVNFESYEARGIHGEFILTKKEALLLKLLIENKGSVVSRERILHTVWGYNVYPSTRTIDNFILAFRKYFEKDPRNPRYFISLRGVGYKFEG
ncbi:MAG: two component transcriptional regulator, winged helix family protein [Bacteroidota bacterium]|jgi:two-component system alkaline phosphatase synthesis response regulator PhoP